MIILKTGTRKYSIKELAFNLLKSSGGLVGLKNISLKKLMEIDGIGEVKNMIDKALKK